MNLSKARLYHAFTTHPFTQYIPLHIKNNDFQTSFAGHLFRSHSRIDQVPKSEPKNQK